MRRLAALALVVSCQRGGAAAPARTDVTALVGAAERAAIADLDGDGRAELVLAGGDQLRVVEPDGRVRAAVPAPGAIQALAVWRGEIVAGWGRGRDRTDAPARVTAHRLDGDALTTEEVLAPETSRAEITALVPRGDDLLIAHFVDEAQVRAVTARRGEGGWEHGELATIRMATGWASGDLDGDGADELVVGRVYGDARGDDGDAFLLGPGGARTPLPTVRGVRGLAIVDGEVYAGDGWHRRYGAEGRGFLVRFRRSNDGYPREVIDDGAGQYTIWKIVPADLDGDGAPELVTMGSHRVDVHRGGRAETIGGAVRDVAAGDLDGVPGDELLLVGDRSEIVRVPRSE
jgi:hypothetical protein